MMSKLNARLINNGKKVLKDVELAAFEKAEDLVDLPELDKIIKLIQ